MNSPSPSADRRSLKDVVARGLRRRYRRERLFRWAGFGALTIGLGFLAFFFATLIANGYSAFLQTRVLLEIEFSRQTIDPAGDRDPDALLTADYQELVREALRELFPDVVERADQRALYSVMSAGAGLELRERVLAEPSVIGTTAELWLLADDDVDMVIKGAIDRAAPEAERRVDDRRLRFIETLEERGLIERQLNRYFFTSGDSRDPELAGIWSATVGSFFTLLVTLALSFPLGVATAIYLEEFAPRNRWTDLIEVN